MENFLTTEELLLALTDKIDLEQVPKVKTRLNKTRKRLNKYVIYWSIVFIAVLHLVFAAIPLIFQDRGLTLIGYRYDVTYEYNEETSPQYELYIALHRRLNKSSLSTDNLVVTFARFGTRYYSVETVININLEQNIIETSFDSVASQVNDISNIDAIYVRRANQIETLYYIFGTPRGFFMLFLGNLVIFGSVYIYYINPSILKKKEIDTGRYDGKEKK